MQLQSSDSMSQERISQCQKEAISAALVCCIFFLSNEHFDAIWCNYKHVHLDCRNPSMHYKMFVARLWTMIEVLTGFIRPTQESTLVGPGHHSASHLTGGTGGIMCPCGGDVSWISSHVSYSHAECFLVIVPHVDHLDFWVLSFWSFSTVCLILPIYSVGLCFFVQVFLLGIFVVKIRTY